jgi:hypothetical protein
MDQVAPASSLLAALERSILTLVELRADLLQRLMHDADQLAWSSAALALALNGEGTEAQQVAAGALLDSMGIAVAGLSEAERLGLSAQAAAPLLQTAAMLGGRGQLWAGQSDEALVAQGRASAQGAQMFAKFGLPMLSGLAELLAAPEALMLDVGTGVAALAVAYAELFPSLTVVGLDVLPRALALAAVTVAGSTVSDRIIVREQDVSTLDEVKRYALAWLPAPFIPEVALREGAKRAAQALVPGGWLMVGHGKFAGDSPDEALTRFKTVAFGGTALSDEQAQALLQEAGLGNVATMPTPPGAPAITVGRQP